MSKFLSTFFGLLIFFLVMIQGMGIAGGFMEQYSYVQARSEYLQRIVEVNPVDIVAVTSESAKVLDNGGTQRSAALVKYYESFKKTFGDGSYINIYLKEDRDADGQVSYGDVIEVTMVGYGNGRFGFTKSAKYLEDNPGLTSNKVRYMSSKEVMVQNRRVE